MFKPGYIASADRGEWPDVAIHLIEAAALYSNTFCSKENLISQGLICLASSIQILRGVNAAFRDIDWTRTYAHDPKQSHFEIVCQELPQTKERLKRFLSVFHLAVIDASRHPLRGQTNLLEVFYGTIILFLIRSTLRSILQPHGNGYETLLDQALHDVSFDKGPSCPLYQPMLSLLAMRPFGRILWALDDSSLNENRELPAYYHKATNLIPVSQPLQASP
ncbi:hypothetical protein MMC28_001461 [Mycoblastus sanguinarius]|nr:hypothetical protein [Mycoblastus sanguinarius]